MTAGTSDIESNGVTLGKGAATVAFWTAISRATGFLRVVVVAGALGATHLANTYNSANTAPNLVFELMAAGVLTSVFVPTFVRHLVRGDKQDGWSAANALTSTSIVGLAAVAALVMVAAPWLMQVLLVGVDRSVRPDAVAVGTDLLRFFAPQIVLYGAGMIMTAALHAHRRFAMAAIAPILNNLVVIGVYLTYAALRGGSSPELSRVTTAQVWVLGLGTTLGVAAMTLCLIPALRGLGWRFRFRADFKHPAVREGARLGVWALSYAGGYQAGLIVVLLLANRVEGGFAAYQWAFTFFYLPHALFGVPIFNVLFTAMSERVAQERRSDVAVQLRSGLRMLWFLLLPISAGLIALASPITDVSLHYGVMTSQGAELVARILIAFALGLPAYSAFLVLTRAFYAFGDTRTPALINLATVVLSSSTGVVAFFIAPEGWEVPGLALGHSVGALVAAALSFRSLRLRLGPILDRSGVRATALSLLAALVSGLAMCLVVELVELPSLPGVIVGGLAGGLIYLTITRVAGSEEIDRLRGLARRILRGDR